MTCGMCWDLITYILELCPPQSGQDEGVSAIKPGSQNMLHTFLKSATLAVCLTLLLPAEGSSVEDKVAACLSHVTPLQKKRSLSSTSGECGLCSSGLPI
ncbi:hypothetical protein NITGR_740010 [Nitrospina gracilis 3/211]|uniref:Uncharacterized protein n=1 Tax=Nitrospina gracilis (strain 3/211) TaxID=1266370 RepID=M1YMA3_NITG3|nr:hypothetical protein NITGR_740010 [Nitrospina gracilis 3/211]